MIPVQSAQLWRLFVAGDIEAFKILMDQSFGYLFKYGSGFTHDQELIKDTIQELFILLWSKKENISIDVNPKAYLISSCRRALHRKIESQKRFLHCSALEERIDVFHFEVSVEETIIRNESITLQAKEIAANITNLPSRQREVVYLKFFEGMSREEISEVMGISTQTVSNMLQMALRKLRIKLASSTQLIYSNS